MLKFHSFSRTFITIHLFGKVSGILILKVSGSESEVAQSCPTLCDAMDCNQSGSCIHWLFQARVLEWIAISFSRGSSWPRKRNEPRSLTLQADALPSEPPGKRIKYMIRLLNQKHKLGWKEQKWKHEFDNIKCLLDFSIICVWKSLSRVQLFVIPWTVQSMEFSRPKHLSG